MAGYALRPQLRRDDRTSPRTAFVLGVGGNLGAIQVGMLQALADRGILPDELIGCSVGAINAAALAEDPTPDGIARMNEIWSRLDSEVICPPGRLSGLLLLTRKYRSLQSNDPLRHLPQTSLGYQKFQDTPLPLPPRPPPPPTAIHTPLPPAPP